MDGFAVETRAQKRDRDRTDRQESLENVPANSSISKESRRKKGKGVATSSPPSGKPQATTSANRAASPVSTESSEDEVPLVDNWTYPLTTTEEDRLLYPDDEDDAHLLIGMHPEMLQKFREGYQKDRAFKNYYVTEVANASKPLTPSRFEKGSNGLLYFIDADWNYRLCVPETVIPEVL
ncbi:hypothetical protein BDZ89DRAFT_941951 [Hymenopellis radicata]|nr:hypothetical protein BDZ89DRAFT_941951 [Hymenopellis radicata]